MALRGKMEQSHLMAKLIVWLGCIFVMFSLVTLYIAICAFDGIKFDVTALKWIQLSQTIALFLVPSSLVAYLVSKSPIKWLKLDTRPELKSALWAIGIMLVALPAINLLADINQQMVLPTWLSGVEEWMKSKEAEAEWLTKQFMSATTIGGLLVNLFLMAVLPAVSEEITFRGVLQRLLSPKNSSLNSQLLTLNSPSGLQPSFSRRYICSFTDLYLVCCWVHYLAICLFGQVVCGYLC